MGGYHGLLLATGAGTSNSDRITAYVRRLTPAQYQVFYPLVLEARKTGRVPDGALEAMRPLGPWPDPFEDTCAECGNDE